MGVAVAAPQLARAQGAVVLRCRLTGTDLEPATRRRAGGTELGIPYLVDGGSVGYLFGQTLSSGRPEADADLRSPVPLHSKIHPRTTGLLHRHRGSRRTRLAVEDELLLPGVLRQRRGLRPDEPQVVKQRGQQRIRPSCARCNAAETGSMSSRYPPADRTAGWCCAGCGTGCCSRTNTPAGAERPQLGLRPALPRILTGRFG